MEYRKKKIQLYTVILLNIIIKYPYFNFCSDFLFMKVTSHMGRSNYTQYFFFYH
jgi:hypothetical protein